MSISIAAFFFELWLLTSSPNCLGGGFINPAWNQVRHSRIRERRFLLQYAARRNQDSEFRKGP